MCSVAGMGTAVLATDLRVWCVEAGNARNAANLMTGTRMQQAWGRQLAERRGGARPRGRAQHACSNASRRMVPAIWDWDRQTVRRWRGDTPSESQERRGCEGSCRTWKAPRRRGEEHGARSVQSLDWVTDRRVGKPSKVRSGDGPRPRRAQGRLPTCYSRATRCFGIDVLEVPINSTEGAASGNRVAGPTRIA